ncbi:atrial natriuretic peptide-converting enzyme, partial [Elysia marginata]
STSPRSLPISASPRTIQEISYHGRLNLSSPWSGGEAELRDAVATYLHTMLQPSPWFKPFIIASFVNISTDMRLVSFRISFEKVELEDIVAASDGNFTLGQGQGEGHSSSGILVADALQTLLREQTVLHEQFARLPDSTWLLVQAPTIYIEGAENIPVTEKPTPQTSTAEPTETSSQATETSTVETTTTATTETPTTYQSSTAERDLSTTSVESTTTETTAASTETASTPATTSVRAPGQCTEMVFTPCYSMLNWPSFYLPNWLEHSTQTQAVSAYTEMKSTRPPDASTECLERSELYLCALLFPPCERGSGGEEVYESVVNPCQSLCNDVVSNCGAIEGWPNNCDTFPTTNCTASPPARTTTVVTTTEEPTTTEQPTTTAVETTTEQPTTTTVVETTTEQPTTTTTLVETTTEQPTTTTVVETTTEQPTTTTTVVETTTERPTTTTVETTTEQPTTTTTVETTTEQPTTTTTEQTKTAVETTTTTEETTTIEETTTAKETTTAETTTAVTTPTTTTTTEQPFQCMKLDFPTCNDLGFKEFLLPNTHWNCQDEQCLFDHFYRLAHINDVEYCRASVYFYCSYVFHGCSHSEDGSLTSNPVVPCHEACDEAKGFCPKNHDPQLDCKSLSLPSQHAENAQCVEAEEECASDIHPFCKEIGFLETTKVYSWFSRNMTQRKIEFETFGIPSILKGCSANARFLYCGYFYPSCWFDMPCPSYCWEFEQSCSGHAFPLNCSVLEDNEYCLRAEDYTLRETTTTTTTTTTAATTPASKCEKIESALCKTFGFTEAMFPNGYGDVSELAANRTYYQFAEHAVSSGCHDDIAFYMCSVLFPPCDGAMPCRSLCEEVNDQCSQQLFGQGCFLLSDGNEETCLKPPEKRECSSTEYSCVNTNKCIPLSSKCDQINDCEDWSDERDCDCDQILQVPCAMGLCIPSYHRCDGKVQCPDESDENDCRNCTLGAYECNDGTCIPPEWLCDGDRDCEANEDEQWCDACSIEEFMCKRDTSCIPFEKRCDGVPDCLDSTDEINCVFAGIQENWLLVNVKDESYPFICAEGFTEEHGINACLKSGFPSLESINRRNASLNSHFFMLDPHGPSLTTLGRGQLFSKARDNRECPDKKLISIKCEPKVCGVDQYEQAPIIINGKNAYPGRWPWTVSFQHFGIHKCGGGIIHPYFILTAAHCARDIHDMGYVRIVAGTEDLGHVKLSVDVDSIPDSVQVREIRRFIKYPGYTQFDGKDIALLELKTPLTYTKDVRPLCLPEPVDVFSRTSMCRLAGWGHTSGTNGEICEPAAA